MGEFNLRNIMQQEQQEQEKQLSDLTEIELESLCYRQIIILEQAKNNINILQNELNKRSNK